MKVAADLYIVPMGVRPSVSRYVREIKAIVEASDLSATMHANGTSIAGELIDIFRLAERCEDVLAAMGVQLTFFTLIFSSRRDKDQTLTDKITAVSCTRTSTARPHDPHLPRRHARRRPDRAIERAVPAPRRARRRHQRHRRRPHAITVVALARTCCSWRALSWVRCCFAPRSTAGRSCAPTARSRSSSRPACSSASARG